MTIKHLSLSIVALIAVGIFITPIYAEATDLRLLWLFEEESGDVVKDSSGNGNDSHIINCERVEGKFGGGLQFNGQSSLIEVLHNDSIDFKSALTVEAWYMPLSFSAYTPIARKGGGQGGGDPSSAGWGLDLGPSGDKLRGFIYESPGNPIVLEGVTSLIPNEWHHVAMVYDKKKIKLYLNGNLDGEMDCKGIDENTGAVWVGQHVDKGFFLHGVMDELALWASARTEEQLLQDAQGIKAAVEPAGKLAVSWGGLKGVTDSGRLY